MTGAQGSSEDDLIARHFKPLATHPGAFGLTDDAAAIQPPPGCEIVLQADAIMAGVHFFADDPADSIAQKALRTNLSDLAAKGADPLGFLLTLALPAGVGEGWLAAFADGLRRDIATYACPLMGGDTVRSPGSVMVSIAAFGAVPTGKMVRRAGARSGDRIVVTGTLGDAALGLILRQDETAADRWRLDAADRSHLLSRFLLPRPRDALAHAVRAHASAAMDVSDGLAGDLTKLCHASGVGAAIDAAMLPLSKAAAKALAAEPKLIETILAGGDDYEILCAVPPDMWDAFERQARDASVAVTDIGVVEHGKHLRVAGPDGAPLALPRLSFSHF
jgi:thiamine-monophosphate kinase